MLVTYLIDKRVNQIAMILFVDLALQHFLGKSCCGLNNLSADLILCALALQRSGGLCLADDDPCTCICILHDLGGAMLSNGGRILDNGIGLCVGSLHGLFPRSAVGVGLLLCLCCSCILVIQCSLSLGK
jgi:hypothetical protein